MLSIIIILNNNIWVWRFWKLQVVFQPHYLFHLFWIVNKVVLNLFVLIAAVFLYKLLNSFEYYFLFHSLVFREDWQNRWNDVNIFYWKKLLVFAAKSVVRLKSRSELLYFKSLSKIALIWSPSRCTMFLNINLRAEPPLEQKLFFLPQKVL